MEAAQNLRVIAPLDMQAESMRRLPQPALLAGGVKGILAAAGLPGQVIQKTNWRTLNGERGQYNMPHRPALRQGKRTLSETLKLPMMKHPLISICISALLIISGNSAAALAIHGAGSSAFNPIYVKWASVYEKQTGISVDYDSIGSNNGISAVQNKTVHFGASDVQMTAAELAENGLLQFPTVIEGIVPVINLRSIGKGQLKLSGKVLADIFGGKISRWNDTRIAADNPGVSLPDQEIKVAYRTDNSATTLLFTTYLSQVSADWKSSVGAGRTVSWKTGSGKSLSEGIASHIENTEGSIGYVSYGIALQRELNYVQMKTHDGNFIKPSVNAFKAAYQNSGTSNCYCEPMINKPGSNTWPIANVSHILIRKTAASKNIIDFFGWAFRDGEQIANELGYALLPKQVNRSTLNTLSRQLNN